MRHSKVEPGSFAENSKSGEASALGCVGATSIVVAGAIVSTVQLWLAGVGSTLPAASPARTWKVWLPSARLV